MTDTHNSLSEMVNVSSFEAQSTTYTQHITNRILNTTSEGEWQLLLCLRTSQCLAARQQTLETLRKTLQQLEKGSGENLESPDLIPPLAQELSTR